MLDSVCVVVRGLAEVGLDLRSAMFCDSTGLTLVDGPCDDDVGLYLVSIGAVGLGDGLTRPDLRCWTLRTRRERIWLRLDVSRILPDVKGSEPCYLHF